MKTASRNVTFSRRDALALLALAGVDPGTPKQFGAFVKSEMVKWAAVIKRAGIKPD